MTRDRRSERGQAMVEFALVIPLLLLLVVGVLDFGRAIYYWLDLNDTAEIGARYAVVSHYPGCVTEPVPCAQSFTAWVLSDLNAVTGATAAVCYVDADNSDPTGVGPTPGDPIRVTITKTYNFIPFIGNQIGIGNIDLVGRASMRLESPDINGRIGIPDSDKCV